MGCRVPAQGLGVRAERVEVILDQADGLYHRVRIDLLQDRERLELPMKLVHAGPAISLARVANASSRLRHAVLGCPGARRRPSIPACPSAPALVSSGGSSGSYTTFIGCPLASATSSTSCTPSRSTMVIALRNARASSTVVRSESQTDTLTGLPRSSACALVARRWLEPVPIRDRVVRVEVSRRPWKAEDVGSRRQRLALFELAGAHGANDASRLKASSGKSGSDPSSVPHTCPSATLR